MFFIQKLWKKSKDKNATAVPAISSDGKIKFGWFSFSCSEDSSIVLTELLNDYWQEWKKIFDFRHAKILRSNNTFDEFEIAFIEGAIASEAHINRLRDIRQRAKYLVAVGACAVTGLPAGQRNNFEPKQKTAIQPLVERFKGLGQVLKVADVVQVDAVVPGCPMDPKVFLGVVNDLVLKLRPSRDNIPKEPDAHI